MSRRVPRLVGLSVVVASTTLAAFLATPASAQPAESTAAPAVSKAPAGTIASITDGLARNLATTLADESTRTAVVSAALTGPVDLAAIRPTSFASGFAAANRSVLAAKGLPDTAGSMMQVRIADPSMNAALAKGAVPLVAGSPNDDSITAVTAYRTNGRSVVLDAVKLPKSPVLVVEVNTAKALPLGLKQMDSIFASRGVAAAKTPSKAQLTDGYWATKMDTVRLNDDEEPWVEGDAEIYTITGGFGFDSHVAVATEQMPYLDNDGTTYTPGQVIVHWFQYKYNLADVVMMEDDGDTNYQQLAIAIADALLTIADGGAYIPLVNAILNAIPTSWWTNDPDYADSWYTLAQSSSGHLVGAASNGQIDVVPYWVSGTG